MIMSESKFLLFKVLVLFAIETHVAAAEARMERLRLPPAPPCPRPPPSPSCQHSAGGAVATNSVSTPSTLTPAAPHSPLHVPGVLLV